MATESTQPGGESARGSGAPFEEGRGYYRSTRRRQQQRVSGLTLFAQPAATTPLGRGLGWFSIGLGIAALAAPSTTARLVGHTGRGGIVSLVGLRELGTGAGILASRNPAPWLWARVAGDVMDIALLATGLRAGNPARGRTAIATTAVAGISALDVFASWQQTRAMGQGLSGTADVFIEKSISINASPQTCYEAWRRLEELPRFMRHLESVRTLDDKRSHWRARAPGGQTVEWDAEITEDRPGEKLSWRSLENAQVANAGSVRFQPMPHGRGTILRISLHYAPPAGQAGAVLARILGEEPSVQLREDLRRFKQIVETGEIATTRGQPSGRRSMLARFTREGRLSRQPGDSRAIQARVS